MTEVNFFHVIRTSIDEALPEMLEKTVDKRLRAVAMVGSPTRSEALTQYLWIYRTNSFLAHGNAKDGDAVNQPIWITHLDERPNQAEVLFLLDGMQSTKLGEYIRVCDLFDGRDDYAVVAARVRYKAAQSAGYTPKYWQQSDRGWEKKRTGTLPKPISPT